MRFIRLIFASSFLVSATAQRTPTFAGASPSITQRDVRWVGVEELAPGETIELRERGTGVRTDCVVDYVNDAALGCSVVERTGKLRRVVYPQAAVDRVWVTRWVSGPSGKAYLIGTAVGAVLGGLIFSKGGGRAACAGVVLGGATGGGMVGASDPLHLRMSTRRVLLYRTP